ncbi:MAG: dTDP-glucose 4,6-dehydratase, partial [Pseudomonadota bacterium]
MKILITGGAGFIGSNLVRLLMKSRPDAAIVNVDKLTYAGNLENLSDLQDSPRYRFILADISEPGSMKSVFEEVRPDVVLHLAAESHVDRSIEDASPFIRTNIEGTQVLLDNALSAGVRKFVHVSTDEVYGSLREGDPAFTEEHPLDASSPYSASKAASDLLVMACHRTHGLPAVITRCSNNYGPYQFPEKLIPLMIRNALNDEPLPVYGDGRNIRDWIHVADHCEALALVAEKGVAGQVYNIGGQAEVRNIEVVQQILKILGKPESLIRYVKDRPGHDWRYAMDIRKIRNELGWSPSFTFEKALEETVIWYTEHPDWVDNVISGQYR